MLKLNTLTTHRILVLMIAALIFGLYKLACIQYDNDLARQEQEERIQYRESIQVGI